MKEVSEVTSKKDKLENQFSRLDQIEREFERAIRRVEECEEMIKAKNEQIEELKKQSKTDKRKDEIDGKKGKAALEALSKGEQKINSLINNQVNKIKQVMGTTFDKVTITKEFEVVAAGLKSLLDTVSPSKLDPNSTDESL